MRKIVSLVPSATEIVCAINHGHRLVGRSHECDYPKDVIRLPACTRSLIDATMGSEAIDQSVKKALSENRPLFEIDHEMLANLNPGIILTQSQCETCAVDVISLKKEFQEQFSSSLTALRGNTLNGIFKDILDVSKSIDATAEGEKLCVTIRKNIAEISKQIPGQKRPRVACIEWIDPLMSAGNWVPRLVELAGGVPLFSLEGSHSHWITEEELQRSKPDVILIMACGFDIEKNRQELQHYLKKAPWLKTHPKIYLTDSNHYFTRPGPRIDQSVRMIAEILFPNHFSPTYEGIGWEKFDDL